MTGPLKAAVAFACLLGLAACGGGGGGGSASPGGAGAPGNGSPGNGAPGNGGAPTDPGYLFAETAAAVTSIDATIAAYAPDLTSSGFARSRNNALYSYWITTSADNPPDIVTGLFGNNPRTSIERTPLGGDAWRFDDDYTQDSTEYEGVIFLFWDPEPLGGIHRWGVWLRRQVATDTWDEVEAFNLFNSGSHPQLAPSDLRAYTGSATYTGAANGVYTKDGDSAGWFGADQADGEFRRRHR